jgi:hypothetical protein
MSDRFTEQLSPYLDGELDDITRARLEAHLAECLECTRTLNELRDIVAAAPGYAGQAPERDLWPHIVGRLDEDKVVSLPSVRPPVRPSARFSWRELIAASIVMAAVGGGAAWLAIPRTQTLAQDTLSARPSDSVRPSARPTVLQAGLVPAEYDAAIRDLEQLLEAGRDQLEPETLHTIELSLSRIDTAIREAQAAIQRDSTSTYLNRQIAANMRRKLNLLRTATNAIAARS